MATRASIRRAWKKFEERVAAFIGGKRVPVSGRARGDKPDVDHSLLGVECKYRDELPGWIKDALSQAKAASNPDQIPVVIMGEKGEETGNAWVLMKLSDFREWFL